MNNEDNMILGPLMHLGPFSSRAPQGLVPPTSEIISPALKTVRHLAANQITIKTVAVRQARMRQLLVRLAVADSVAGEPHQFAPDGEIRRRR